MKSLNSRDTFALNFAHLVLRNPPIKNADFFKQMIQPYSDVGPVFLMMLSYSLSVLAFAFVLASSLRRATVGAMLSVLFYLVTFLPFIVVLILEEDLEFWHKLLAVKKKCLFIYLI